MKKLSYAVLAFAAPVLAFAQSVPVTSFDNGLLFINRIINQLIPIVIGLAVLFFLFALLKYVTAKDAEAQIEARNLIITGIVVLFVMVSVWGLVNILKTTFQLNDNQPPPPQVRY